jgi:hypothetical protein
MSIFRQILCSPLSFYTNQSLIHLKEVFSMRIPHSAVCCTDVACLSSVYPVSSLYVLLPMNQRRPGTIYKGNTFACCQRPSQRSTLPFSTEKHSPTLIYKSQTLQPSCCGPTLKGKKMQLVLSHLDKSKLWT